ncbi:MAG: hypothetical protein GXO87_04415 [Chlorobi bacterium]|nr:hypothetical protein [Chlorobiota bacterium]
MPLFNKKFLFIFLFISAALMAQDKSDAWKEKVKNISGDVSEIVIKTDKGEVKLTGEEAEDVMELLKSDYLFSFNGDEFEMTSKGEGSGENVFVVKMNDGRSKMKKSGHHSKSRKKMVCVTAANEEGDVEKNIEAEFNDGKKKITVTTVENGKKTTKVYEGEEAEKFLESEEGENIAIVESMRGCKDRRAEERNCRGRRHGNKVIIIDEDDNVIMKDGAEKVKVIKVKVEDSDEEYEKHDEDEK